MSLLPASPLMIEWAILTYYLPLAYLRGRAHSLRKINNCVGVLKMGLTRRSWALTVITRSTEHSDVNDSRQLWQKIGAFFLLSYSAFYFTSNVNQGRQI